MESNICIIPDVPKEHFPLKEWKINHLCIYRYSNNVKSAVNPLHKPQQNQFVYVYSNTFPAIWLNHYAHLLLRTQGKFSENPNRIRMGTLLVFMYFTQRERSRGIFSSQSSYYRPLNAVLLLASWRSWRFVDLKGPIHSPDVAIFSLTLTHLT